MLPTNIRLLYPSLKVNLGRSHGVSIDAIELLIIEQTDISALIVMPSIRW